MTACGWFIGAATVGEATFWGWILGGAPDQWAICGACAFFIIAACAKLAVALDRGLARWQV
jgi:hypothetical protein